MEKTRLIMRYLEGGLDVSEHEAFLNQLSVDACLTKELCLHQEVDSVLADPALMAFNNSIRDVYREFLGEDSTTQETTGERRGFRQPLFTGWRAIISMVAVVCIVLATFLVYKFVDQKPFHEKVYSQFYQPYALDLVSRSGTAGADPFLQAIESYNSGNYSEALLAFDAISPDQTQAKDYLLLLKGICYLEMGQPGLAVESFHNILVRENMVYASYAKWYLSLSYLKLNEIDKTRLWLREIIKNEPHYARDASKLLHKLN